VAQTDTSRITGRQPPWGLINAIGYGAIGAGVGFAAAVAMSGNRLGPSDAALATLAGTTLVGTTVGAIIGGKAQRTLARRQPIGLRHESAVVTGTILGGAALGALASAALIAPSGDGPEEGENDALTFSALTIGGAALASWYVSGHRDRLRSWRVGLTPAVMKSGSYAVNVRVQY
jgi:hypothetical protein